MPLIELATPDDLDSMSALLAELFSVESEFTPDSDRQKQALRLILDEPSRGALFVARDTERVIGMMNLIFMVSTAEGGPVILLEDVVVGRAWRGGGVGSALVRHAQDFARRHHYSRITLLTDRANAAAIRFYERLGFTQSTMQPMRWASSRTIGNASPTSAVE